jgi:hypothetical protein
LKCIGSSGIGTGIYLAGNGTFLEDVYVDGFYDGILLGYNPLIPGEQSTAGNVLVNITGGPNVTNVVHLCGYFGGSCGNNNVTDLTVLQVKKNGPSGTTAILDEESPSASGQATKVLDSSVAIYAIGESGAAYGGVSRFTTATQSANVPTWLVGNGAPSTASSSCNNENGTLYSNNANGSPTLYVCVANAWKPVI